jgi:protoporphyrinogen/coproporphyrinogen III oxidase
VSARRSIDPPFTVAIIGGGITGLTAAYRLARNSVLRVVVFEASDILGGQISTHRSNDSWVELGADSFLARETWALDLCRELGIEERLISPAVFGAYIWWRGRVRKMPSGTLFGIPLEMKPLYRSGLLSPVGLARAWAERFNRAPLEGPDIPIARFVKQRFGREVLERLVDPMLAGTRSGDPRRTSLAAALPEVDALARRYPSLLNADLPNETEPPKFYSLNGGLETLIDSLKRELSAVSLQTHTQVQAIEDTGGEAVTVRFVRREPLRADAVIVAVPPPVAAQLMAPSDGQIAHLLSGMAYSSARVLTMWFQRSHLSRPIPRDGSGYLVPSKIGRTVSACTWWSRKWPMSQADPNIEVLRCFVGRSQRSVSQGRLIDRAINDLRTTMGIKRGPFDCVISDWEPALPFFEVGHLQRAATIDRAMQSHPRVVLAGIPEKGSGITECVRRGLAAADQVVAALSPVAR